MMDFGIKEALTYFKDDKHWKKKIAIGYVIMLLHQLVSSFYTGCMEKMHELAAAKSPLFIDYFINYFHFYFLGYFVASTLLICLVCGYITRNTNLQIFKPSSLLYEWKNLVDFIAIALKQTTGVFVYLLVSFLPFLVMLLTQNYSIGLIIFSVLFFIVIMLYLIVADVVFCADLKFSSYFKFSAINKILKHDFKQLTVFCLITTLICIISSVLYLFFALLRADIVFFPLLTIYLMIVISKIKANFARYVFNIESSENQQV